MKYTFAELEKVVTHKRIKAYMAQFPSFEEQKASTALLENILVGGLYLIVLFPITYYAWLNTADYVNEDIQNYFFKRYTLNE